MLKYLTPLLFLALGACAEEADVLPTGDAQPALVSPYFPDRLHEFVFRNWSAVPAEKLAALVGARPAEITAMAVSMGLPATPTVPPEMFQRGYVTLIRRNWHLLPYEQLLLLLDKTPEQLSVMLREEDFLWVKLGRMKPAVEPLHYHAPDATAQARVAEIRKVVEQDFGASVMAPGEPRFDFVRQFATGMPRPAAKTGATAQVRIVYSYVAVFGDPLLNPALNPYPDGLLQQLADSGINGVWLHAVLRDLAPGGAAFPEFGDRHAERLENLRALVARAKRFGIDVYLYINEPRGMPAAFFAQREGMAGVKESTLTAMCTSAPEVRQWMGDALAHVFHEVPGLGGVYTITASENLTNCASHGDQKSCARCRERSDADIITEVNAVIEEGVHRGAPDAKVLVSDWGWRGHGNAPDMVERLPKSAWLMSVSEWNLPIERGGVKSLVGEYSISSVGPGPRALGHWEVAASAGLRRGTEIQFNNTCEIASIPYLPVLDLVAEHCRKLPPLDALFIGWTMGGHPSPNLRVAALTAQARTSGGEADVLTALALERFGAEAAPLARKAWTQFSNAFREYPFHISVVYTSPVQWGAANPLYAENSGYSATMWGIPYDDLNGWRGPYPPEVFAAQFDKMAAGWRDGVETLAAAVEKTPENLRGPVQADLRYARAAGIHFQSVANQSRFVMARDLLADPATTNESREPARAETRRLLLSEIALAKELHALACADSRIGFEPSCQYFYLPQDLVEKVVNCRWLLEQLAP